MPTTELRELIDEARSLAEAPSCERNGHDWEFVGARSCPREGEDGHGDLFTGGCSQSVYRCRRCRCYDFGEPSGPAHAECFGSDRGCRGF